MQVARPHGHLQTQPGATARPTANKLLNGRSEDKMFMLNPLFDTNSTEVGFNLTMCRVVFIASRNDGIGRCQVLFVMVAGEVSILLSRKA